MFYYAADSEVARFITWEVHKSIEDSTQLIRFLLRQYELAEPSNWAIALRNQTQQMIGTCGFMYRDREQRLAEMGYALALNSVFLSTFKK